MKLKTLIKNPSNIAIIAVTAMVFVLLAVSFAISYPRLFFVTVEFDTDYGTPIDAVKLRYGSELTDIPVTTREYNTFGGWFLDKEYSLPYTGGKLSGNTKLYAKWNTIFDEQYFENLSQRLSISMQGMEYESYFIEDLGEIILSNNFFDLSVYNNKRIYSISATSDDVGVMALFSIVFANRQDAEQVGAAILAAQSAIGDVEVFALDTCLIGIPYGLADVIFGEQIYSDDNYYYLANKENTRLTILKYKGQDDAVAQIPASYNGIPVTSIGAYAFFNSNIMGVSIPQGVQTIGYMSFAYCYNLQEITLPNSVERIGDGFAAKKSGFARINLPDNMQNYYYKDDALYEQSGRLVVYCGTEKTDFEMQDGIKTISCYAFAGHNELTEIRLSEDLTNIGAYAFFDCSGIEEYNIPASVYGINEFSFAGVQAGSTNLKNVNFADESNLIEIGSAAFANNPNLEKFVLKKGLRALSNNLLANCTGLVDLIFEEGSRLHTIERSGLVNCISLTEVNLPNSVTSIGDRTFENCVSLKSINIGSAARIGEYAMYNCISLENIEYNAGLAIDEIGVSAFANCLALTEFNLPKVNTIRDNAFSGCGFVSLNLTQVSNVCYRSFSNCLNLVEVIFGGENGNIEGETLLGCDYVKKIELIAGHLNFIYNGILGGLDNIEEITTPIIKSEDNNYTQINQLFWGSVPQSLRVIRINNDIVELPSWYFAEYTNITEVYLPQTIQSIGEGAFTRCTALTTVSYLPNLKMIGSSAFYECINLQEFALADSVTSIGDTAFFGGVLLKQVNFPAGLKSIGSGAYKNCSLFTSIILPDNMDYVASNAFASCHAVQEMRVPLAGEQQTKYPKSIKDYIVAYDNDFSPIIKRVELTKDTSVIAGNAFANLQELEEIIFPDSIVRFENNALNNIPKISKLNVSMATEYGYNLISGCPNLKELTIRLYSVADTAKPSYYRYYFENEWGFASEDDMQSVTKVIVSGNNTTLAKGAFRNANKLEEVVLPDSLTRISDETFAYCAGLKSANIPTGAKEIGVDAFIGCSSLTSINIPSGVYSIDKNAFRNCTALKDIIFLQDSAINILGESAFAGCTALQNISFPSFSVWQLPFGLFSDCTSLKTIALPQSLQYIRTSAFERSGLQTITIPERVRTIDWFAFKDCKDLQAVDIQYSDKFGLYEIGREAFAGCSALTSIVLPPSLSDIVGRAFAGCTSLSEVYVLREYDYRISPNNKCTALRTGTRDDGLSDNVFDNCSPDIKFFVPINNGGITESDPITGAKNGVDAYKTIAQGWGDYANRIYPLPDLLPNA